MIRNISALYHIRIKVSSQFLKVQGHFEHASIIHFSCQCCYCETEHFVTVYTLLMILNVPEARGDDAQRSKQSCQRHDLCTMTAVLASTLKCHFFFCRICGICRNLQMSLATEIILSFVIFLLWSDLTFLFFFAFDKPVAFFLDLHNWGGIVFCALWLRVIEPCDNASILLW